MSHSAAPLGSRRARPHVKLAWKITAQDVARVRAVVAAHRKSNFVRERFLRNVRGEHPVPTGARFWKAHLMGLLTTQQRSGPTSAVTRFLGGKPFRLTYGACRRARRPEARIAAELRANGGIRRVDTVAAQAARNLEYLRGGGWEEIRPLLSEVDTFLDEQPAGIDHRERQASDPSTTVRRWLPRKFW